MRWSLLFVLLSVSAAFAHESPMGWSYPTSCCSNRDCREVVPAFIKEGRLGYEIVPTGEIIGYSDKRLKDSPDQEFHWCSVSGLDDSKTICLFVPPRSF